MSYCFQDHPELSKKLNELARHEMIERFLKDLRVDIEICRLEGWDYFEYLQEIKEIIDSFYEKSPAGAGTPARQKGDYIRKESPPL